MPKAAVDENGGFVLGEHDIGPAGEVFAVEAVAVSVGMEEFAHEHFGLGVLAAYAAHVVACCGLYGGFGHGAGRIKDLRGG